MPEAKRRIGEHLVSEGLVTPDQVLEALREQQAKGGKTVEILIALGHLNLKTFVDFLASQPGIPSMELANYELPHNLHELVPREFVVEHELVPIDRMGKLLTVGMAVPLDTATINELEEITGLRVKPMLCAMDDIRIAIEKYYPPEAPKEKPAPAKEDTPEQVAAGMRLVNISKMIRGVESLPTLPETVQKVREALEDPSVDLPDVAAVVAKDPPVAAKVISVANSPAFGFSHRVDSVEMATTLLGLRDTYSVVTSVAVVDLFKKLGPFNFEEFWANAQHCAHAAAAVARVRGERRTGAPYTAGLLHNIGQLVLAVVAPERYGRLSATSEPESLIAAELEEFGVAHPEAGYLLAQVWNLPEEIAAPIRFHHDLEHATDHRELVACVWLATLLARHDSDGARAEECGEALEILGMSEESLEVLADALRATQRAEQPA